MVELPGIRATVGALILDAEADGRRLWSLCLGCLLFSDEDGVISAKVTDDAVASALPKT